MQTLRPNAAEVHLGHWQKVDETNPLCRSVEDASRRLGYVFSRSKRAEVAAILSGPPGLGKSEAVRRALDACRLKGHFAKPADYRALLHAFEFAASSGRALILEEADNLFRSENSANVLKIAMDSSGPREWLFRRRVGKEMVESMVPLTAPLVLTTNKNMKDDRSFEPKMRPHISALISRSAPIFIEGDRQEQWEYSCYLAICHRAIQRPDERTIVPVAVQNRALEWFTRNLLRLADGSPRTLKAVCKYISYNPDHPDLWERDMRDMIAHPSKPNFLPPPDRSARIIVPEQTVGALFGA